MKRIHVLTAGFTSPSGQAFLMPLLLHRRALAQAGLDVRLFHRPLAQLTECDALLLDGKYFAPRWAGKTESALEEIDSYRQKVANLIYVDLLDSAGWDHARALPYVRLYCKPQVLRDRSCYLRPMYGYRDFSDYYHRKLGVNDRVPVFSEPVADPSLLDKLTVSWNLALADYSWPGPYQMNLYRYVQAPALLRFPTTFYSPSVPRSNGVSCRIWTQYIRDSVSFQRRRLAKMMVGRIGTEKLSRRRYIAELRNSKIGMSPFGYGEIALRDFEIILNGAIMLKPDMSGLETWPDVYRDGETMVAHRWDLSDVEEKIDAILTNYKSCTEIAVRAQAAYRTHLCDPGAGWLFAEHLSGIIAKGANEPEQRPFAWRQVEEDSA